MRRIPDGAFFIFLAVVIISGAVFIPWAVASAPAVEDRLQREQVQALKDIANELREIRKERCR